MNTITLTQRGLLRAILERPYDDLPRLALADWCEENGREGDYPGLREMLRNPSSGRVCLAYARSDESTCLPESPCLLCKLLLIQGVPPHFVGYAPPSTQDFWIGPKYHVHRGLIDEIGCALAVWESYGPELCALHPVTTLHLTDRAPANVYGWSDGKRCFSWFHYPLKGLPYSRTDAISRLPGHLFPSGKRRADFGATQEAERWASLSLINWARGKNGLAPLEGTQ